MFSLGIVFFEMLYPCSTGMQRAIVLRDLRNLTFPEDFDSRRFQNQKQIIQMLLSDNPKDRPSCQELLTSKLLPPKFEEQELAEAFRTLVNPENFSRISCSFRLSKTNSDSISTAIC